jgi:oligopeptide/dipeptide ABC transporter ATP-binding protein
VMIAIALACNPEVVIADEPTTALDVTIQAQILDLMNKLRQESGASILLITHDFGVVSEMAHWVIVMYAGEIVERASAADLFDGPKHPYTVALMASLPNMDDTPRVNRKLRAIPGMIPSLIGLPKGCVFRDRCPRAFEPCMERNPVLLEVAPEHWVSCWLYEK